MEKFQINKKTKGETLFKDPIETTNHGLKRFHSFWFGLRPGSTVD